jgi:hypothetical protein
LPEKSRFRASVATEFWRVKIDFAQNRTKLPPLPGGP